MSIAPFDESLLEAMAKVLGDTSDGLTGSEIERLLAQCGIADVAGPVTKWRRLFDALATRQSADHVGNNVAAFVQKAMSPARYVGQSHVFGDRQARLNQVLALAGLRLDDSGTLVIATVARTASEAEARAGRLRAELIRRQVHADVLKACRTELLQNNYFHAVLEATKSMAEKVRNLGARQEDGAELIYEVFGNRDRDRRARTPPAAFNSLRTQLEESEHRGLMQLMLGVFAVFRNPAAHELKDKWAVTEQEALDLLTMVSFLHRRLDAAVQVPRP